MKKLLCIVLTIVLGISMFTVTSVFASSVTNDIPGDGQQMSALC